MEAKVISKTVRYGQQHWRINADGSYSALAFGFFISTPNARTPRYSWIDVAEHKVPDEVKAALV